jgi:hypothetical protein
LLFSAPSEIPTQARTTSSKISKSSQWRLRQAAVRDGALAGLLSAVVAQMAKVLLVTRSLAMSACHLNSGPSATQRSRQLCAKRQPSSPGNFQTRARDGLVLQFTCLNRVPLLHREIFHVRMVLEQLNDV